MWLAALSGSGTNYTLPILIAVATIVGVIITAIVNARIRANDRKHESKERDKDRQQALEAVRLTLANDVAASAARERSDRDARLESQKLERLTALIQLARSVHSQVSRALTVDVSPGPFDETAIQQMRECVTQLRLLCRTEKVKGNAQDLLQYARYMPTLITTLWGYAEPPSASQRTNARVQMHNATDQVNKLIDALLASARIELGINEDKVIP